MGIINLTPDSFSDGGKYNKKNKGFIYAKNLIKNGCSILDIGGESSRPGSSEVLKNIEWKRIHKTIKKIKKLNSFVSLDTRKSWIMEKAIDYKVDLINENTLNKKIELLAQYEKTIYPISAINFKGINILLKNSVKKVVENKIEKEKTKNKWDPID